ncbi:hypothetical protein Leryth_011010 [Lithospermum erythrorhizon]|uniref:Oxidoreductase n=1 Tax=Lithospermum erythrorhizon TaxID=34254 RepID=A0AAV3NUC6_LITER|nr:hypothetical protein Leryth_011010 [Lithospermum erythrorhizon]
MPYATWPPPSSAAIDAASNSGSSSLEMKEKSNLEKLISENAVIVFASKGCCMLHALRCLLLRVGLNPTVYHIDDDEVVEDLERIIGGDNYDGLWKFPVVFVGGKLFGGFEKVMMAHISGDLVKILKEARALWL